MMMKVLCLYCTYTIDYINTGLSSPLVILDMLRGVVPPPPKTHLNGLRHHHPKWFVYPAAIEKKERG